MSITEAQLLRDLAAQTLTPARVGEIALIALSRELELLAEQFRAKKEERMDRAAAGLETRAANFRAMAQRWPATLAASSEAPPR